MAATIPFKGIPFQKGKLYVSIVRYYEQAVSIEEIPFSAVTDYKSLESSLFGRSFLDRIFKGKCVSSFLILRQVQFILGEAVFRIARGSPAPFLLLK